MRFILLTTLFCLVGLGALRGQACDATFTASETNPCGLEVVTFTVTNPNSNFTYDWNFGDAQSETNNPTGLNNNSASGTIATHAFTAGNSPTSYTVTLTARAEDGTICDTETVTITTRPAPSAVLSHLTGTTNFSQCPTSLDDTFELNVSNQGSTNGANYTINWGDGSPDFMSTSPPNAITHIYAVGNFTLTYTVTIPGLECPTSSATYNIYNGSSPGIGLGTADDTQLCAPGTITFDVTNFTGNTDDTVYDFIVSDGRDTVRYTQDNIPTSITTAFNTISCDFVTVGGDPDAFTVEIIATNPCGLSRAFRTPIRVGRLPVADFSIEPEPQICEEALHTFVNRSTEGVDIDATGCTDRLDTRWTITPIDGGTFSYEDGTNMFNDSIIVSFSGGEYQISMIAENGCGTDIKTETICVLTNPDSEIDLLR